MAAHYGTAILPARPYKPRDKAKVEAAVLLVQRWIAARLRDENSVTLKKFYKEGTRVRLQPANVTMEPIYTEATNVRIEGRVVGVLRQMF
jgi:transposase